MQFFSPRLAFKLLRLFQMYTVQLLAVGAPFCPGSPPQSNRTPNLVQPLRYPPKSKLPIKITLFVGCTVVQNLLDTASSSSSSQVSWIPGRAFVP
ncbi:hypothetical protein B0H14DRAFT_215105 [Mycena olivaceomarginata]|nr:hypothetical protein B0H14DRAFT_215105 [Mycena olivaceomarginata]